MAAGRIAQRQRAMSIWNVYQGLVESSGLTGQYGSDSETMKAVHAIASVSRSWQTPKTPRADSGGAKIARHRGAAGAADAEPDQEDAEDDGERVHRRAEHQAEQAGPDDFRAERGRAGEGDGDVDRPIRARVRRRSGVA